MGARRSASWGQAPYTACFGSRRRGTGPIDRTAESSLRRDILTHEAGREGFWLARFLMRRGVEVHVMQPSSLPVDRRARRAKTDVIDVEMLLRTLMAWLRDEPRVCSMVPIPDEADEEARRAHREREGLVRERRSIVDNIHGILATLCVKGYRGLRSDRREQLALLRQPDGAPVPQAARVRIERLLDRLELILRQIKEVEAARDAVLKKPAPADEAERMIRSLVDMRAMQQTRASGDGGTRLAVAALAARQHLVGLVPRASREGRWPNQEDHDRGTGPQASRRALALRQGRRHSGGSEGEDSIIEPFVFAPSPVQGRWP